MNTTDYKQKKYKAFISYSHRDKKWGDWLHKALEHYRVPKSLIGTPGRDGPVPKRLFPVFRDREELPTSADLSTVITHALDESAYLIVICSPRSAKSIWVNEEILSFKRLGREGRILAIIVDGEPNASDITGKEEEECFPEALRYKIGPDGQLSNQRTEPIAADARDFADGKLNAKLKLLAGLLGINFNDLKQRERIAERRRQRVTQLIAAGMTLLATAAITLGIFAYTNEKLAEDRLSKFQRALTLNITASAERVALEGDQELSSLLNLEAIKMAEENNFLDLKKSATAALRNRIGEDRLLSIIPLPDTGIMQGVFSGDTNFFLSQGIEIRIWDVRTGFQTAFYKDVEASSFLPNENSVIAVLGKGQIIKIDAASGRGSLLISTPSWIREATSFPKQDKIFLYLLDDNEPNGLVYDIKENRFVMKAFLGLGSDYLDKISMSHDGKLVAIARSGGKLDIWSIEQNKKIVSFTPPSGVIHLSTMEFSLDNSRLLLNYSQSIFEADLDKLTFREIISPDDLRIEKAFYTGDKTRLLTDANDGKVVIRQHDNLQKIEELSLSNFGHAVGMALQNKAVLVSEGVSFSLYDIAIGDRLNSFSESNNIRVFAAGEENNVAVGYLSNRQTKIYDLENRDTFKIPASLPLVEETFFSKSGYTLATVHEDNTLRFWQFGPEQIRLPPSMTTNISPDGRYLSGIGDIYNNPSLTLWDLNHNEKRLFPDIAQTALKGLFSQNSKRIVARERNSDTLKIWSLPSGASEITLESSPENPLRKAAWSSDGAFLAVGFYGGIIGFWDLDKGKKLGQAKLPGEIQSLQFDRLNKRLLISTSKGEIQLRKTIDFKLLSSALVHTELQELHFSPSGKTLYGTGYNGKLIRLNAETGEPLPLLNQQKLGYNLVDVNQHYIHFSYRDTKGGDLLETLDPDTGEKISESYFSLRLQQIIAISPEGEQFVASTPMGKSEIRSSLTGETVAVLSTHQEGILKTVTAKFNPTGEKLITVADGKFGIGVWNTNTGERLIPSINNGAQHFSFNRFNEEGDRLVISSGLRVNLVYDLSKAWHSGKEIATIVHAQRTADLSEKDRKTYLMDFTQEPNQPLEKMTSGEQCDHLAGNRFDPNFGQSAFKSKGQLFDSIDEEAESVCEAAVKDHQNEIRYLYQLARAQDSLSEKRNDMTYYEKATANYQAAATKEYPMAIYALATMLDDVKGDEDTIRQLYQQSFGLGVTTAASNLAFKYLSLDQAPEKAVEIWEQAADMGDPASLQFLASMRLTGNILEQDKKAAYNLYLMAEESYLNIGLKSEAAKIRAIVSTLTRHFSKADRENILLNK